jgi:hypothetical protein
VTSNEVGVATYYTSESVLTARTTQKSPTKLRKICPICDPQNWIWLTAVNQQMEKFTQNNLPACLAPRKREITTRIKSHLALTDLDAQNQTSLYAIKSSSKTIVARNDYMAEQKNSPGN